MISKTMRAKFSPILPFLLSCLCMLLVGVGSIRAQNSSAVPAGANPSCIQFQANNGYPECCNGKDDDGDGRADFYGATINGKFSQPDPKCLYGGDTEKDVPSSSDIIPCTDKCTLESVFLLINKVISFFFTTLLLPLIVLLFMYAGFRYITAQGNSAKVVNLKKMIGNLILGLVLMLTAWLIVKTILIALGQTDSLIFFE